MPRPPDHELFELGDVVLQSGRTLRGARLAYKTYGRLNADRSNAIVYPTWYSGRHWDNEWLTGPGRGLDPERWCIVVPNMIGNGLSSSPSTTPPQDRARFPDVTMHDNVECQHRLVTEHLGMPNAELRTIPGVWGHFAGGGANPVDVDVIDDAVEELLAAPPGGG